MDENIYHVFMNTYFDRLNSFEIMVDCLTLPLKIIGLNLNRKIQNTEKIET